MASVTACTSLFNSQVHPTTVPVWSNATTLRCSHCLTNMIRLLSSNYKHTPMCHGTNDNAGLLKQPRDVLSMPIAKTSPSQIGQLGGTSRSYCTPFFVSATLRTGQRRLKTKALWSKLNVLVKTAQQSSSSAHSAANFGDFCSKVNKICVETANALLPIIVDHSCKRLSAFDNMRAMRSEDSLSKLQPSTACCIQHLHETYIAVTIWHPFMKASFLKT